jgi:hypothetical protein
MIVGCGIDAGLSQLWFEVEGSVQQVLGTDQARSNGSSFNGYLEGYFKWVK